MRHSQPWTPAFAGATTGSQTIGSQAARCLERELPVVLVNRAEANARVSAVVSDDMAGMALAVDHLVGLGLYDVLHERRLTCPGDLSVVGHNDMPLVDMVAPPLTTARIGHREMGQEAAQLLMRAINREAGARLNIVLAPTLMIRKSTAAPR